MNKYFFILSIIVFLFKTQTVFSNSSIYDVNNIEVSGKIDNSSTQKKLIQKALQKAFITFVNKRLLRKDAIDLYNTKISTIEDLVFTYQIIKDEKKDKKKNILTINIKFDPKKISNFLARNKISYADVTNISLTLLPVFIKDKDIFIYNDNFFYNNWLTPNKEIKDVDDILINYSLALENIEDLEYINSNKENLELIEVKKLFSFNDVENYAFLLIYFTEGKFRAYVKTSIENKKIDKNLNLKVYLGNEARTYEEAIINLKKEISQIWKEQNLIDVSAPLFLDLYLDVNQINDYVKLRSILNSLDVIEEYFVLEMTDEYTKVRLKYRGKVNKLKDKLLENKINFKIIDSTWRITLN